VEQGAHATIRRVMVDHLTLPVRGFEASRGFYLSALAPLGFGTVEEAEDEATFGAEAADDVFSIAAAGERPCGGVHLAFSAKDRGGGRLPPRPSGREDETTAPRVPGRTTGRATTPPSSSIPTGTTWRPSPPEGEHHRLASKGRLAVFGPTGEHLLKVYLPHRLGAALRSSTPGPAHTPSLATAPAAQWSLRPPR